MLWSVTRSIGVMWARCKHKQVNMNYTKCGNVKCETRQWLSFLAFSISFYRRPFILSFIFLSLYYFLESLSSSSTAQKETIVSLSLVERTSPRHARHFFNENTVFILLFHSPQSKAWISFVPFYFVLSTFVNKFHFSFLSLRKNRNVFFSILSKSIYWTKIHFTRNSINSMEETMSCCVASLHSFRFCEIAFHLSCTFTFFFFFFCFLRNSFITFVVVDWLVPLFIEWEIAKRKEKKWKNAGRLTTKTMSKYFLFKFHFRKEIPMYFDWTTTTFNVRWTNARTGHICVCIAETFCLICDVLAFFFQIFVMKRDRGKRENPEKITRNALFAFEVEITRDFRVRWKRSNCNQKFCAFKRARVVTRGSESIEWNGWKIANATKIFQFVEGVRELMLSSCLLIFLNCHDDKTHFFFAK